MSLGTSTSANIVSMKLIGVNFEGWYAVSLESALAPRLDNAVPRRATKFRTQDCTQTPLT